MKNYKKNISTLFVFLLLGAWFNVSNADECNAAGTVSAPITATASCATEPDIYKIKVYEMGLCTTAPTLANMATACTSVSKIPAGGLITVANGTNSAIPGTFTRPDNGSYSHGYIVIASEFRITATKTFVNGLIGQSHPTSGTTCWTLAGTKRNSNETTIYDGLTPVEIADTPSVWLADCSDTAAAAAPAETVIVQDSFSGSPIGAGGTATAEATINGATINAHLTDDTLAALATTSADVTRLVGFVTFPTAVVITDESTTFTSSFRTTQGSTLATNGTTITHMDSGPFVVNISVE